MNASLEPPGTLRIGTSGWIYRHWRERFYPADLPTSRWFEHYARTFDTVEINYTFYRLPEATAFDQWREQAPPNFLYAVKASRFLTHRKKLSDPEEPLERLMTRAEHLGKHLGPILYQFPPRWKRNLEKLRRFCELLPRSSTHVFEFRDPDWLADETFDLMRQFGVSLCVHDRIENHTRLATGPIVYIRFHGGPQPGGGYPHDHLARWAEWLREAAHERPLYIYFNNDWDGHAIHNALALRELLA